MIKGLFPLHLLMALGWSSRQLDREQMFPERPRTPHSVNQFQHRRLTFCPCQSAEQGYRHRTSFSLYLVCLAWEMLQEGDWHIPEPLRLAINANIEFFNTCNIEVWYLFQQFNSFLSWLNQKLLPTLIKVPVLDSFFHIWALVQFSLQFRKMTLGWHNEFLSG